MKGKVKIYPNEETSCGLDQELGTLVDGKVGAEKEYPKPLKEIISK